MVFRPVSRSVRRAAGGLVVLAFLVALAVPAQAAPRDASPTTTPTFALIDWVHGVWAWLGFGPAPEAAPQEPDGLETIWGKEGCDLDPQGSTCPESGGTAVPPLTTMISPTG
jgi:hypothetical protein